MKRLKEEGVQFDACVTDPPYHLTSIVKRFGASDAAPAKEGATGVYARSSRGFMGKTWDGGDIAMRPETWRLVFDLLKPGAHIVVFGGTRTHHRIWTAIEDAGFDVRDTLAWLYGQGFPKSHNIGDGWGTALKPAMEPICLARKPLIGAIAENVASHGTGAINIDGCRIPVDPHVDDPRLGGNGSWGTGKMAKNVYEGGYAGGRVTSSALGRWPANVVHDGSDEVLAAFPCTGDAGSAARFFYCAKASKAERGESRHPTVKPVSLMRWLVRLVTPKNGLILDPFAGSGTTGEAAMAEGFGAVLIEREPEYVSDIQRRIECAEASCPAQGELL